MSDRWTEHAILDRLRGRFPAPAFVLLPHVRNGTGFAKSPRTADAIAISCWPSRGIYLTGIEIKVTLHDWRKELAAVKKAEPIQRYCRYWYVAAPKGVIPAGEIPETWGLLEVTASKTLETKPAPKLEETKPDLFFVAALCRNVSENFVSSAEAKRRVDDAVNLSKQEIQELKSLRRLKSAHERLVEDVRAFEEASGVEIREYAGANVGKAFKLLTESGVQEVPRRAERWRDELQRMAERMSTVIEELGL